MSESHEALRVRIEAALRARHGAADVRAWSWCATPRTVVYRAYATVGGWSVETSSHECRTEADALAALASVVGLDADGSDPRAEVAHLEARRGALLAEVDRLAARDRVTWGAMPTAAEVAAHVARAEQYSHGGAPWLRRYVAFDGSDVTGVEVVYLTCERDRVVTRRPTYGVTHLPTAREVASEWRPIGVNGEEVPLADAQRARLAETPADLRGRIEAALRERWPDARVSVRPPMEDRYGGHDAMAVATWGNVEVLASGEDEQTALGEVAGAVCLELREHADHLDALLARQHALLTGVADALRGDPGPLASHSHHDLAERAAAVVAENERRSDLLDEVAHAHERDVLAVWAALGETHEPPESLSAVLEAIVRLREELAAAQEIIAGRKMAPTDAEVEAHKRVRGLSSTWVCVWEGRIRVIEDSSDVRYIRGTGGRPWWPLDATGRPCAWPTVTP